MFYVALTTSYKSGGLNPPSLSGAFEDTFDPEIVNAIEIGNKISYGFKGRNIFNWTFFNYDYTGLQTSKIIDRTSVNENVDATNSGLEVEWKQYIGNNFRLDFTYSLLTTEIGSSYSVNTGDPANYYAYYDVQEDGSHVLKDENNIPHFINAKNGDLSVFLPPNADRTDYTYSESDCGGSFSGGILECTTLFTSAPQVLIEAGTIANNTYVADKTVLYDVDTNKYYVSTDSDATYNTEVTAEQLVNPTGEYADRLPSRALVPIGVAVDLSGNQLPNAPEASYNIGLNYTNEVAGNRINISLEYYWQEDFYYRIYNTPSDLIQSWEVYNLNASIREKDDKWSMNFFIKNITNDDFITGAYFTDASSGNFTNVFLLDPRTVGANFRINF